MTALPASAGSSPELFALPGHLYFHGGAQSCAGHVSLMSKKPETRNYPRKVLRGQARIALPGMPATRAKTLDVSLGGICLLVPEQLPTGRIFNVGFEAPLNGNMVRVFAAGKVIYSILAGTEGFRTGLQFTEIDAANNKLLAELMI